MMNAGFCGICKPSDEETKLIQDSLYDRLRAMMHTMQMEQEGSEESSDETLGFQRLIKIIFHRKFKNFKTSTHCKHQELRKEFAGKLKCNFKVLDVLSDRISCITAKYSFHIDVVSSQVKTFPRHFIHQKSLNLSKLQTEKEQREENDKKSQKLSSQNKTENKQGQNMMLNPYSIIYPPVTYPIWYFPPNQQKNKQ